ncbi:hypothetical protein PAXRUDRAFT_15616 [Paxillus rubicundulus Ve08.2h10]|uniref:Uncharacterized protein n=1 Tax=Paxillus rubicundulus Ve08.2h10 TaxID=930991 RepID=A0A0D0DH70_9AGAM|nr:hypothetical protein PAXRUDRAFT_15616 [Paxillus rubicundulus Ve08.2h10]
MQQFNRGGAGLTTLWRVSKPSELTSDVQDNDAIKSVRTQVSSKVTTTHTPQDEHIISPWLCTTRWHEHVGEHDIQMLRRLVKIPGRNDDNACAPGIKGAVKTYFDEALALLPLTGELVLQKLNSPDPAKDGINNTPLHRHQDPNTMAKYVVPVIALLCLLLRVPGMDEYKLPLPSRVEDSIAELGAALQEKRNASQAIHRVFTGHRASSIAFVTKGMPRIFWTDHMHWKELLYNGDKIHVDQLRAMFAGSNEKIIDIWEKKVLKGIHIHINYSHLSDSLANQDVGYSFLTDKRNTCFSNRDILGNAFMADASIKAAF